MPDWVLPVAVVSYVVLVVLTALAAGFSSSEDQRDATFRVLKILLPWGLLAAITHMIFESWIK